MPPSREATRKRAGLTDKQAELLGLLLCAEAGDFDELPSPPVAVRQLSDICAGECNLGSWVGVDPAGIRGFVVRHPAAHEWGGPRWLWSVASLTREAAEASARSAMRLAGASRSQVEDRARMAALLGRPPVEG